MDSKTKSRFNLELCSPATAVGINICRPIVHVTEEKSALMWTLAVLSSVVVSESVPVEKDRATVFLFNAIPGLFCQERGL